MTARSEPLTDPGTDDRPAARITPYPDGPLVLRGDFELTDVSGNRIPTGKAVALCRCGRSAQKPFCDGSHKVGVKVTDDN